MVLLRESVNLAEIAGELGVVVPRSDEKAVSEVTLAQCEQLLECINGVRSFNRSYC